MEPSDGEPTRFNGRQVWQGGTALTRVKGESAHEGWRLNCGATGRPDSGCGRSRGARGGFCAAGGASRRAGHDRPAGSGPVRGRCGPGQVVLDVWHPLACPPDGGRWWQRLPRCALVLPRHERVHQALDLAPGATDRHPPRRGGTTAATWRALGGPSRGRSVASNHLVTAIRSPNYLYRRDGHKRFSYTSLPGIA